MDNSKVFLQYENSGAKGIDSAGATAFEASISTTSVGFMNTFKNEASMAFYSVQYQMETNDKVKVAAKTTTSSLPVTMGAEVAAASWLKLRGSISQNVFMGSSKAEGSEADSIAHNTTTAAGAGFVWGKNNLDVVMTMGTDGSLDASTLGTNASYTYTF